MWKKKYASLGVAELRQLRQLQERRLAYPQLATQVSAKGLPSSARGIDDLLLGKSRLLHRFFFGPSGQGEATLSLFLSDSDKPRQRHLELVSLNPSTLD